MLTIREIEYKSQEHATLAFSRLTWAVDEVGALPAIQTVDMSKDFVGILDMEHMAFTLMFPAKLFYLVRSPGVIAQGIIKPSGQTSSINIKIKGSLGTFLMIIFAYTISALMIFKLITGFRMEGLFAFLSFCIVFPGLGTWWLNKKLSLMEKKVEALFNVGKS